MIIPSFPQVKNQLNFFIFIAIAFIPLECALILRNNPYFCVGNLEIIKFPSLVPAIKYFASFVN